MPAMTQSKTREIIDDFAKEIQTRKLETAKPATEVINFRDDLVAKKERSVVKVPIGLLRFRKDNGRIASDILDYEKNIGVLIESDEESQAEIRDFLEHKDPEKTSTLMKSIIHAGQMEPAIITCDGFLINGNRRKMVMDKLHHEHPENENYAYMKVVILPGEGDEGGPPTLIEIEKLENRYQLQSDGKSEYYGFDRALSIKRKIDIGLSLEDQLLDDPQYAGETKATIKKAVNEYKKMYLYPLECVDRYLRQFNREGQYRTVSSGMTDREGRWQAFIDYSNTYNRYFNNPGRLIECGIDEDEIGEIEEAAFDIIRLRTIPDVPKSHVIMRNLHKYCGAVDGKKEILKISQKVEPNLPIDDCFNNEGNELEINEIDAKWAATNREDIIFHTKRAIKNYDDRKEKETPIGLLEAAYKKLIHDDMDLSAIAVADYKKARKLAADVKKKADEIESQIYHQEKKYRKLEKK